jgi:hypothetical protein
MRRWNRIVAEHTDDPEVDAFLEEVIAVCKKHGFSIAHEDGHGSFLIQAEDDSNFGWLRHASIDFEWVEEVE